MFLLYTLFAWFMMAGLFAWAGYHYGNRTRLRRLAEILRAIRIADGGLKQLEESIPLPSSSDSELTAAELVEERTEFRIGIRACRRLVCRANRLLQGMDDEEPTIGVPLVRG